MSKNLYRRRSSVTVGDVAAAVMLAILSAFGTAWLAMVFLGAAHSSDSRVPAFGFGAVFWLALAFTTAVSAGVQSSKGSGS